MRSGRIGRVAIAACFPVALLVPRASVAQAPVTISGSAEVTTAQLAREGTLSRSWTGAIMGARGGITFGRLTLEGQYAQGSLTPETGTLGDGEDLVDGVALLRVQIREWLSVGGGPRVRGFVTPAGTSRWTRFEGRVRAEGEVINGLAFAHFEGWYALAVDANVQGGGRGAKGGEAGISVRLPRTPVSVQLTYTADHATFSNGASEFLEGVGLSVQFGRF